MVQGRNAAQTSSHRHAVAAVGGGCRLRGLRGRRGPAQGSAETDRAALEALYDAADGPNWTDSTNWKTNAPLDQWHGVTTDTEGRVRAVDLSENALTGPIPVELGNLGNLEYLRLWGNALTGPIPRELGDLRNLKSLELWWNELTGSIPTALGNLRNLEHLYLGQNALTGPIPAALGNLRNLKILYLSWNELTGPIPAALGNLRNLRSLRLRRNALTGPIPAALGNLSNLEDLRLSGNELTGPIPKELGNLRSLERLDLSENWGISGTLPPSLQAPPLEELDIFFTQTCAPTAWRDRLKDIAFNGRFCEVGSVTIDVAVVYTPAARELVGGRAAIEAIIDLWIADANVAYDESGVQHRVALVAREEVDYVESGNDVVDLRRLADPSDGHMDGVHPLRDRTGADLVHLLMGESGDNFGRAWGRPGEFSWCIANWPRTRCFVHELGHNMGLSHDRYDESLTDGRTGSSDGTLRSDPAYGYINQRAFVPGAARSRGWFTIMAKPFQCHDAPIRCWRLHRFSNSRQRYDGDPMGVPPRPGKSGIDGPADAVAVLNVTGPAIARWRDRPGANRAPVTVGTLPDRTVEMGATLDVDVSQAFADADGDTLSYGARSSSSSVAALGVSGSLVTVTAVSAGTATVTVTATDPGGLRAAQSFTVTVTAREEVPFTDESIRPGVTPVRAVHFTELRTRIDALRRREGLTAFAWTDRVLTAGVTAVKLVHLTELRAALAAAYRAAGRSVPRWTDPAPVRGNTAIRAVHLMELRRAVTALE